MAFVCPRAARGRVYLLGRNILRAEDRVSSENKKDLECMGFAAECGGKLSKQTLLTRAHVMDIASSPPEVVANPETSLLLLNLP